ncbi:MAG: IS110 family transposase [Hyphomicrobiales bacterium]|nr:IS110 family transposase [Hyphomicrobiales bacterium]
MSETSTKACVCAGIDVGKASLAYALAGGGGSLRCANTPEGRARMIAFLASREVRRVGMESTGAYHFEAAEELRAAGFEVVVLQPMQVNAYAKFKLKRAKSDPIDAQLIAQCTAAVDAPRAAPDPRLAGLAEHLTMIEQIEDEIARAKVRRERYRDPRLKGLIEDDIKQKTALRRRELRLLVEAVRAHKDLARKLDLLQSIQGVGERTALALVVRMPELGALSREEAASLLGVAPFDHDSGRYKGQRRIGGGRARPRTSLFAAAQAAARRWNPALVALYDRLVAAGKSHTVAIVACVRKLIIYANTVLAQDRPWKITQGHI